MKTSNKTKKTRKPNKCANCEHAVFEPTFGEYKCLVKQHAMQPGSPELTSGCDAYKENEGSVKISERVFGGM